MGFLDPRPGGWTLRLAGKSLKSAWGRFQWTVVNLPVVAAAIVWRRMVSRATVIAVTGSRGKTTAKDFLAAILSTRGDTVSTFRTANGRHGMPRTVLAIRPRTQFAVVEVGIDAPGLMWRGAAVVKPDVVIVTCVADEHMDNFPSEDAIAAEKQVLVESLSSSGVAVLNADDGRTASMAGASAGGVLRFGTAPESDLIASEVRGAWPERLSFKLRTEQETLTVQTQLVGTHWMPSVLAALAGARALGVPLQQAVSVVGEQEPVISRLQPITLESGAVLLRDEYNGSVGTLAAALTVMEEARADRKITILSDFTDDKLPPAERLGDVARRVSQFADLAIFVGRHSETAAAASIAAGMQPQQVLVFSDYQACADYLAAELCKGDLALLKGRNSDHLARIYWRMVGDVACDANDCPLRIHCEDCPDLWPPQAS